MGLGIFCLELSQKTSEYASFSLNLDFFFFVQSSKIVGNPEVKKVGNVEKLKKRKGKKTRCVPRVQGFNNIALESSNYLQVSCCV